MLKVFLLGLLCFSVSAFACWKVEGEFAVDGETFKIHQKIVHAKEYSFPMGAFILNMSVVPQKNKQLLLKYTVHEKKGIKLTLVTKGEEEIKEDTKREIFAKGEEGQPNSILTIKLDHI